MSACPRCTTENADGAARCLYCNAPLAQLALAAPVAGHPPSAEPAWGIQSYQYPGYLAGPQASRVGNKIFLPHGAALPDRCVKCNAPAHGVRIHRNFSWIHPGYLLLLVLGVIPFAIAVSLAGKRADVSVGLCARHRTQRAQAIAGGWTLGVASLILGIGLSAALESGTPLLAGLALSLVALIGGSRLARSVAPSRIDDTGVWLKWAGRGYLAELPPGPPKA